MKKIICVFMLCILMTSCGSKDKSPKENIDITKSNLQIETTETPSQNNTNTIKPIEKEIDTTSTQSTNNITSKQPETEAMSLPNTEKDKTTESTENQSTSLLLTEDEKEKNELLEERKDCDFRSAKWGDDKETVKKYETDLQFIDEDDDGIAGKTKILGYNAFVLYQFENNKFYGGAYMFDLGNENGIKHILAYNQVKDALIEKYGEPFLDKIVPFEDESLIEYAGEQSALELGFVSYLTQWETPTTEISAIMYRNDDDYSISFGLRYDDKNFESDKPEKPNGL